MFICLLRRTSNKVTMINVIVNRTITKHTTPAMIIIITRLSSPRMEGELESTIVTVEPDVESEKDAVTIDRDTNDRILEVDQLEGIKLIEVVGNDDNAFLVIEMI